MNVVKVLCDTRTIKKRNILESIIKFREKLSNYAAFNTFLMYFFFFSENTFFTNWMALCKFIPKVLCIILRRIGK